MNSLYQLTHLFYFNSWHLWQQLGSPILLSLPLFSSPLLLTRDSLSKLLLALWLLGSEDRGLQSVLGHSVVLGSMAGLPSLLHFQSSHIFSHLTPFPDLPDSSDSDRWLFPATEAAADAFGLAYTVTECQSLLFSTVSSSAILHTAHIHTVSHLSPLPSPPN